MSIIKTSIFAVDSDLTLRNSLTSSHRAIMLLSVGTFHRSTTAHDVPFKYFENCVST